MDLFYETNPQPCDSLPPLFIENSASLAGLILKGWRALIQHPELIIDYDVIKDEGGG